ncbi:hypothetical protein I550_3145 [Mycobacterium intracellulare 1956]|uniref:Uncharacterized protein n=1 Tax=Mycobacterium intracellulare 1956 TaxID=1299331 RepID=X8CFW0_MYCIT|nr:hypothetical protein I550_3145 [Mycobacterium intracellulare 1956]
MAPVPRGGGGVQPVRAGPVGRAARRAARGAASLDAADFAALCAGAFDRDWVATLAG